ncbi:exosortase/archaeosortase family protein [Kineococcus rhizosphaerae]|uniref:Exosortase/archaeosortase family protein n=1 Tax=Kineococcus rhizosphaerae TaxID=559628 RepID=A0A2T0R6T1_9ACTN|nr:exosortase/archaeosortase family protein [Kineococcus rhizosphaerae]
MNVRGRRGAAPADGTSAEYEAQAQRAFDALDPRWVAPDRAASLDVGLVRPVLALGSLAVLVALFVLAHRVQETEAAVSAALARAAGLSDAHHLGSVVLFSVQGNWTGYQVTLGCTVAFLIVPFFAGTAVLVSIRRVPVLRALAGLTTAITTVVAFNQLRLLTIALGMATWGPDAGYSYTHVFVGTTISTFGVVLAGVAYLGVLLRGTFTRAGAHHE